MDHATAARALFASGLAMVVLAGLGGMFPWKSRRLSTASIQRRIYWTGSVSSAVLVFASQLPDWRSGLIIAFAVAFVMVGAAWRFTSDVKIGGKVYAAPAYLRQPDPPPARR